MKKKRLFLLILFLIGMLYPIFSYDKVNLSSSTADSLSPGIAIDTNNRILVVWAEVIWPAEGFADIFYVLQKESHWSDPTESSSYLYDSRFPQLRIGPKDRFHLAYTDGKDESTRDIFYRRFSFEDESWSNIERIYLSEAQSSWPIIEVNNKGKIYMMWILQYPESDKSDIVLNSKPEGRLWSESYENVSQEESSTATHPSFKVDKGNIYACWTDNRNGTWDIFYNEKIGKVWKIPESIGFSGEKQCPSLVLDSDKNIHIIYNTDQGTTLYTKRADQLWKPPTLISTGLTPGGVTDLKLFKDNTLHAVWRQKTESGISIFYGRATSEGDWLNPIEVAEGQEADSPRLALDDYGNAHIVWEDSGLDGYRDIFYAKVIPPGTRPEASLHPSEEEGIVPLSIRFNASGSLPGEGIILSYWWDFGDGSKMAQGQKVNHTFKSPGNFVVRLYVTNSHLLVGCASKTIQILPGPYPPVNIQVRKTENRGLFYREMINALTWEENLKNREKVTISSYNIYRKFNGQEDDQFKKIGQVNAYTYEYVDRDFLSSEESDLYVYAVSAVDDQEREGPKGLAVDNY